MNVKWLVESGVFEADDDTRMLQALLRNDIGFHCFSKSLALPQWLKDYRNDECVVFRGSLNTAKQLEKWTGLFPGAYCDFPKYACTNYYALLGENLLNKKYIMLPYGDLLRQKEFLYGTLASDNYVFVRPSRGDKPFTGRLVHGDHFENFMQELSSEMQMYPEDMVVVASPQTIKAEWRFVVVDKQIVTGDQYLGDIVEGMPAWKLADKIASIYQPDRAFTLDICLTEAGYSLLELNSFSCAGLYNCNLDAVVRVVSRLALEEWHEYD